MAQQQQQQQQQILEKKHTDLEMNIKFYLSCSNIKMGNMINQKILESTSLLSYIWL